MNNFKINGNNRVLDGSTYKTASEYSHQININGIKGLMTEKMSYSLSSTWGSLIDTIPALQTMQKWTSKAGVNVINHGVFTRKSFEQGSYLSVSPSFRIVDWDGTGNVLSEVRYLMSKSTMQPITPEQAQKQIAQEKEKNGPTKSLKGTTSGILNSSKKQLKNPIQGSPLPVFVRIGPYFYMKEMIIENIKADFSLEMTKSGPLYADISCTLSSIEVVTGANLGLWLKKNPRVEVKK